MRPNPISHDLRPRMLCATCTNVADRSYLEPGLKGGTVMTEHDRSNQLMIWTMTIVGLVVLGSGGFGLE